MKLRHTFWKTAGKKPFSDTSGEGLMLKDKDSFQSCLVTLTHTIVWCFHLSSTLTEWIAPREAHSVPYSAETRMLLNDGSLYCPSYRFMKLCSDWNSQGQSYLLATRGEKWNLWWKAACDGASLARPSTLQVNSSFQHLQPGSSSCAIVEALLLQLSCGWGTAVFSPSSPLHLFTCSSLSLQTAQSLE